MVDPVGDEYLDGDEHLKPDERWVRHLLEGTAGQTRVTDLKGGPEGRHDLEAELMDGRIAAIEITSEADEARLRAAARAKRHLSEVTVPHSQLWWLVQLTPQADARALNRSASLVALLTAMEQQGQSTASALSDYRDPWRDQLQALGIQSVHGIEDSDHPGAVSVMPDSVASYGWVRSTADNWITEFLASELGQSKLDKLAKADADERHLAVLIHPDTDAGLGIAGALADLPDGSGGDDLPSVDPPSPLTHLWLIAPTVPTRAFRWTRTSGWAVVRLTANRPNSS
jgi:hypothetical protein